MTRTITAHELERLVKEAYELYRSERGSNTQNHAVTWLLANYGRLYDEPGLALDLAQPPLRDMPVFRW